MPTIHQMRSAHIDLQIGDLGIAKLVKDGLARTQIGTPHYMSATHVELFVLPLTSIAIRT